MSRKPRASRKPSAASEVLQRIEASRSSTHATRQEITTAIYALARGCGWEVREFHWEGYPIRSFDWVEVSQGERRFALLIHESLPFVALSSELPVYFNLTFFDDPAFADAVQRLAAPFGVLSAAELDLELSQAESMYYDKYWKPGTVGCVLFNWWD